MIVRVRRCLRSLGWACLTSWGRTTTSRSQSTLCRWEDGSHVGFELRVQSRAERKKYDSQKFPTRCKFCKPFWLQLCFNMRLDHIWSWDFHLEMLCLLRLQRMRRWKAFTPGVLWISCNRDVTKKVLDMLYMYVYIATDHFLGLISRAHLGAPSIAWVAGPWMPRLCCWFHAKPLRNYLPKRAQRAWKS